MTAGTGKRVCAVEVRLLIGRSVREGSGGSRWRLLLWGDDMQNAADYYVYFAGYKRANFICVPCQVE